MEACDDENIDALPIHVTEVQYVEKEKRRRPKCGAIIVCCVCCFAIAVIIGVAVKIVEKQQRSKGNLVTSGFDITFTPSPSPQAFIDVTTTPSATESPSGTTTASATGTVSATATRTASNTATQTSSATETATSSVSPSATSSESGTATVSPSSSVTATGSATASPSPSVTATTSHTASVSASLTTSGTAQATQTASASVTADVTPSQTLSQSGSQSWTATNTASPTASLSGSTSSSVSPSQTAFGSDTPSITASASTSPSAMSPTMTATISPTQAALVQQVSVGAGHSCALLTSGKVKCWGDNSFGQLGTENTVNYGSTPETSGNNIPAVNLGTGVSAAFVQTCLEFSCALTTDACVKCWGTNNVGQLGRNDGDAGVFGDDANEMGDNLPFVDVGSVVVTELVSAGSHSCVITTDAYNNVKCWGRNIIYDIGTGDTNNRGDTAGEMGNNLPFLDIGGRAVAVALADYYGCAMLSNSTIRCWGANTVSGWESSSNAKTPITVNVGTTAGTTVRVFVGANNACVLLDTGRIKCWGKNGYGQLGQGTTVDVGNSAGTMGNALSVIDLGSGVSVTDVAIGANYMCALLSNNTAKCWGRNNYGNLGLGDTTTRGDSANEMGDNLPTVMLPGTNITSIHIGGGSTCILVDNLLQCWGSGADGKLGSGDTTNRGNTASSMLTLPWLNLGA